MRHLGWLKAFVGFMLGWLLGQWQSAGQKPVKSPEVQRASRNGRRQLTREDVLRMIEESSETEDLDLSGLNLEGIILTDVVLGSYPFRPRLLRAQRTNFGQGLFKGSVLRHADLRQADFYQADLRQADLSLADLREAQLSRADLRGADLYRAKLNGADLYRTDLRRANLHRASLNNARLPAREYIGKHILQEDRESYARIFERLPPHIYPASVAAKQLRVRHRSAMDVYRTLKESYLQGGNYGEASWAYFKECQMRRMTHWPPKRARACYDHELEDLREKGIKRITQLTGFHVHHTYSYLVAWFMELSCGYGERPMRTVGVAAAILLVFPFLYAASGVIQIVHHASPLDYIIYSLGAFTTIGFTNFKTTNWVAQVITSIEAFLAVCRRKPFPPDKTVIDS
jgi:uncharacterized protein YjbI with pentapeptide repeats